MTQLIVLYETNVLSLISQRLDNFYRIQMKCYSAPGNSDGADSGGKLNAARIEPERWTRARSFQGRHCNCLGGWAPALSVADSETVRNLRGMLCFASVMKQLDDGSGCQSHWRCCCTCMLVQLPLQVALVRILDPYPS